MKYFIIAALALFANTAAHAQTEKKDKKSVSVNLGSGSLIQVDNGSEKGKEKDDSKVKVGFGMLDIGINTLIDNSSYGSTAAKSFLQVPTAYQNEDLFSLKQAKSINVNVWPVTLKYRIQKSAGQKIYIGSAIGLQMYNFRFSKPVTYLNETTPMVVLDTITNMTKNKLALTYLSMPLNIVFKTKLAEKAWLVYGGGITAGYLVNSLTKQKSEQFGKEKNHDAFNLNKFNLCATGEIGLDDYFRLFVSYQITPMHETALDQHPLCIGFRFGGI